MNTTRTALVLLELQNDFLSNDGKLNALLKPVLEENNVVENLNKLILVSRAAGSLIVHTPIQFSQDYREMGHQPYGIMKVVKDSGALIRGTWGAEIFDAITRDESDIIVEGKSSIDAFAGTNLDFILRSHNITEIVLAGQLTNICIESTMRSAYDKGYRIIGITDATSTIGKVQQLMAINHNWPMFSTPLNLHEYLQTLTA